MGAEQSIASTRPGTPGLDVFKIAGRSISGFLHSFKTGESRQVRLPFTTHLEERLALFLEYHPHVCSYQRGDANVACAKTKAEAARRLAHIKGGVCWIGTDVNLSERRHQNWLYLHARRQPFSTFQAIAAALLAQWPYGDRCCVSEFVQCFGRYWSEAEVEAAIWKLVADAAAEGRLLVDLTEVELSHATSLALLAPGRSPILPDPLPSELEETGLVASASSQGSDEDLVLDPHVGIPGPTFDASVLATAEEQARFHRNLAAVTAVLAGMRVRGVARAHGMAVSTLSRLVRRTTELSPDLGRA